MRPSHLLYSALYLILVASQALAQTTIVITAPTAPVVMPASDEFATDVLQDPWDFEELRDMGFEENYDGKTVVVDNGVWRGVTKNSGLNSGFVLPLFPGDLMYRKSRHLPGDRNLPKFGLEYPINAAKYTQFSFRMKLPQRSNLVFNWDNDPDDGDIFPKPSDPLCSELDKVFGANNTGWINYWFDLTNLTAGCINGPWAGRVHAFRIEPSILSNSGQLQEFDWIRFSDPASAPPFMFRWTVFSQPPTNGTDRVKVYLDDDNVGFNGTPFAALLPKTGVFNANYEYDFPSSILPPGDYYYYVEYESFGVVAARSAYSPKLTVTAKPEGFFTAPSETSGEEYSETVRGDPWDMNQLTDVANTNRIIWNSNSKRNFKSDFIALSPESTDGGFIFGATTDNILAGNPGAIVALATNPLKPVDTGKFRYLTVRMKADDAAFPTIVDRILNGWVNELGFGNFFFENPLGISLDWPVYKEWNTYTADLADPRNMRFGDLWAFQKKVPTVSFSPLRTITDTQFLIDFAKLNAENRPQNNNYLVKFHIEDADSNTFDVDVFYDDDQFGFNGTKIASLVGIGPGNHSVLWDTSSLPVNQDFYVHMSITDEIGNVQKVYSNVHVKTGAFVSQPPQFAVPMDYDGDGASDHTVYRPSTGIFYQNRSNSFSVGIQWVAGPQFYPVYGDFDGDKVTDLCLVFEYFGMLAWYTAYSSGTNPVNPGALPVSGRLWGFPGDKLAVADYDGDSLDEIAIFRGGSWWILDENGTPSVFAWGVPGDIPVPADFDRDGKDDCAIWRPSTGKWWILNSGFPGSTADPFEMKQWGLPIDIPLTGDFNGDLNLEFAVFRPPTGTWYIFDRVTQTGSSYQFGLPGDKPIAGDFNGDGVTELTVFRMPQAVWFHNFLNYNVFAKQYGLPGDRVPVKTNDL